MRFSQSSSEHFQGRLTMHPCAPFLLFNHSVWIPFSLLPHTVGISLAVICVCCLWSFYPILRRNSGKNLTPPPPQVYTEELKKMTIIFSQAFSSGWKKKKNSFLSLMFQTPNHPDAFLQTRYSLLGFLSHTGESLKQIPHSRCCLTNAE